MQLFLAPVASPDGPSGPGKMALSLPRARWCVGAVSGGRFLHDLKLKVQFLAAKNVGEVELPELARESK